LSEVSTKRFTSFNACGPLAMASPCQSLRRWMSMSRSPHKSRDRIVTLAPPHFCEAIAVSIDHFVYRIGLNAGMLAAALGGLDAFVFTAGIGENSSYFRRFN
jgi:hypothetical protein